MTRERLPRAAVVLLALLVARVVAGADSTVVKKDGTSAAGKIEATVFFGEPLEAGVERTRPQVDRSSTPVRVAG